MNNSDELERFAGTAPIVVLDDDAMLVRTMQRLLERAGHCVVVGTAWAEVEERLWPGRFSMLIADILMPDATGIEVLERVVVDRKCEEPVVLMTGEPNLESASAAVRLGAFDYLVKPVRKDGLLAVVHRALRHLTVVKERDAARKAELHLLRGLAEIGKASAELTHEVRAPITGLRHALAAVADKISLDDREMVESLVGTLVGIQRRLTDVLDYARPMELTKSRFRADALCQDARDQALLLLGEQAKGVTCEIELDPTAEVEIDADRQLLQQALVNLLANAGQSCGTGGRIVLHAAVTDRERISWTVHDSGPGIDAAMNERLFIPFQTTKTEGTGLGLAFCRRVADAHGGTVATVPSRLGGAGFQLEIPVETAD